MATKHTYHTEGLKANGTERRLILCIDESLTDPEFGDQFSYSSSNILRLHNSLLRDSPNQRIIYIPRSSSLTRSPFSSYTCTEWQHLQRRDEAFALLVLNFRPDDKIYLFGAGSGAAVALNVARLIEQIGIPAALTYVCNDEGRIIAIDHPACTRKLQMRNSNHTPCGVQLLGLFDMLEQAHLPLGVGGVAYQAVNLVESQDIPSCVERAHHLVALDDHRKEFSPALVNQREGVEEIWFMGVHEALVGTGRERMISDIPLSYMIDVSVEAGLEFHRDSLEDVVPNSEGLGVLSCEEQRYFLTRWHREVAVQMNGKRSDIKPRIHETVFRRMHHKSEYRPPNLLALNDHYQLVNSGTRGNS
ncbi:T6SS phospholipase effector Tle1-like catalytic domain-containing protein [Burkholderia stabilis]|uniref:T6SS Phospholipase effector Tle1-like catalytic domain-containing protein n=1 Tax=Burkholderia stabilis TaxID=95485 RepID=A0A1Y1BXC4_9BURK|nr:DUF2235 domain-containing protein [Burkholderia stabilis]BAX63806.1 hypothetical protein BSFP_066790 [Burkholderia stabilis]